MPLSITRTRTAAAGASSGERWYAGTGSHSRVTLPVSVNLMALLRRLRTICSTRRRSLTMSPIDGDSRATSESPFFSANGVTDVTARSSEARRSNGSAWT